MNLSKTSYCNGLQCKKMLWLYKNKPNECSDSNSERIMKQGNIVHEVARYLFKKHVNITQDDNLSEMIQNTASTIESYRDVVITEASFAYENNFCSVDILKKNNNSYEIYEVKSSTSIKETHIDDISYQYFILTNLGFKINKCYLIHINNKYVRNGNLNLNELFYKEDVTDSIIKLQDKVKKNIEDINKYMEQENEPSKDIDISCFKPYNCLFFNYCIRNLPKPNVFDIRGMHNSVKLKYYKNGIYNYSDLLKENINSNFKKQIEYELYDNKDYINKEKIKEFLDTLTEPLYFLDFETYQMPIPLYDGISPYEQIPFQYSLHYIENGKLYHKEYLSDSNIDPRRFLAESLIKDIPKNVCVLAYNMGFEKSVIKKLAESFPDLKEHLLNIYHNIKDLMVPFQNKSYYTKDMHGSYSIKYVLPALFPDDESLNYSNLELIHRGDEAMDCFINLENMNEEEKEYARERLLRYCELDTFAMVKIYEKLLEVTEKQKTS